MKKSPEVSSATFLAFFALNFTKVMTENIKDIHLSMDSSSRSNHILFPNTELGIDLKLMTRKPGRLAVGEYLDGTITRDGEDHFSFIQDDSNKKKVKVIQRNPHVYEGTFININRNRTELSTLLSTVHDTQRSLPSRISAGKLPTNFAW